MRILWLVIVILVAGYSILTDMLSTANSAIQASQLANQTTARMLIIIALTLAFWFVASERRSASTQQRPNDDVFQRPQPIERPEQAPGVLESVACQTCGKYIARDAVRCRHCGAVVAA